MKTVFSTEDVHPRDRFEYWHSVACEKVTAHTSIPEYRTGFQASLQSADLADIPLVVFENSPMAIAHTAHHAAHANADELFVCRQVAGRLALEQDSREVVLQAGDITLLDPRLPYTGRFSKGSKLLVLKIARSMLEARVGKAREMVARPITLLEGENSLTSAYLAMLPMHAGRLSPATEEIVMNQVLDLVAVSLATTMQASPRFSSVRSLVRLQVRAAIDARLADPALDASTVAAAAGVSVRYANAVLAEENTTIMRLVQARRLERCRRALEAPEQNHRTVSEIAYSWGFSDMTHFGRKFKAAYGILPSEYRRLERKSDGSFVTDLAISAGPFLPAEFP
ncbi:helix-turn-helix domain-containing protein [Azospirillum brasilense]|uniref:AraC-like ligand-binding domain-containing protein n=1 Tax=Azospirillum argentinense TaxID=2970906 RepID=UPI00190D167B|nr:helix-turn-helix domain-containing protein [Azospirillum argentinense]MBK3800709.1 helix-turn-helix domain-containing protein [Azospirillum argentinense]